MQNLEWDNDLGQMRTPARARGAAAATAGPPSGYGAYRIAARAHAAAAADGAAYWRRILQFTHELHETERRRFNRHYYAALALHAAREREGAWFPHELFFACALRRLAVRRCARAAEGMGADMRWITLSVVGLGALIFLGMPWWIAVAAALVLQACISFGWFAPHDIDE